MNPVIFVGHLIRDNEQGFVTTAPVDIGAAVRLLAEFCDRADDGTPRIRTHDEPPLPGGILRLGHVEEEAIFYKDGFLICPWFGRTEYNKSSIGFMIKLANELGCVLYSPGEGTFMSVADLLHWVEERPRKIAELRESLRGQTGAQPER
jgi:hypothetical protein